MVELQKRFGNLVAAHRKRMGMTQDGLAAAADLSVEMIKKIEAGSTGTSFTVIERLGGALHIDPAELFSAEVSSAVRRRPLTDLVAELSTLTDDELVWARDLLQLARRRPR